MYTNHLAYNVLMAETGLRRSTTTPTLKHPETGRTKATHPGAALCKQQPCRARPSGTVIQDHSLDDRGLGVRLRVLKLTTKPWETSFILLPVEYSGVPFPHPPQKILYVLVRVNR